MKKRLLSLLLAITLVLGMMPANVFATTVAQEEDPTCQHTAHTTAYAQVEGTATHTATTVCAQCKKNLEMDVITENCNDANADGKCDLCSGEVKPACESCTDVDNNKLCDVCLRSTNKLPYLVEGVENSTVIIQTGFSYQLHDVSGGKIFTDDDDTLKYESYRYRKSSDGGKTWGDWELAFKPLEHGGYTDSVTNSVAGIYMYEFVAYDGSGYSKDTWTLTLDTRDKVEANISFYVGQDHNYKNNGNIMPILELYVTAGIDENYFDYIGWFKKDNKTVYVYDPQDYTIIDGEKDYVEIDGVQYELFGYEKVVFTNSAFDATATDATAGGTVVDKYNMFYATIMTGRYSTRAYGYNTETQKYDIYLGGQSMALPMEKDIYGNGGNDIYLRQISVYTNSKKTDGTYFTASDYRAEMIMPITGSMIHAGDPYVSGNFTYFPFMSWAAGNGSLYNCYVYPNDTENYIFSQTINNTTSAGTSVVTKNMAISAAMELKVTVPEKGEFGLYFQYNNFNTKEIEPQGEAVLNGDGTKTITYKVSKGNSNYTWRLTDPSGKYVTKSGWLSGISQATEKTITFSEYTNNHSHDFSNLGTQVTLRDEADIQVFLSATGFKSVSTLTRIRAYRMWQLINSDPGNIMVEPDFNIQVLQGNASDIKCVSAGNALNNWIDVLPTTTDIVAVNYNAMEVLNTSDVYGSHGGFFPATNPERTNVFIITNEVAGKAVAHIAFNGSKATDRGTEWDYNYDTWFYLNIDKAPVLDFTVDGGNGLKVSYAYVTTGEDLKSVLSDWTVVTADANGRYYTDLLHFRNAGTKGGTVIIKMEDETGVSYALVRVAEMTATVTNESNPGEPFMPGDSVTVTFDGLYRSINKISGVFNPLKYEMRYTSAGAELSGSLGQYQQMDRVTITLTIPAELTFPEGASTVDYTFTNGYVFGTMYSASSPFQTMYYMTDTGMGTNFSAVGTEYVLSRMADIPITVHKKVTYDVKIEVTDGENVLSGYTFALTDPNGTVLTPDANGIYQDLSFGDYDYTLSKVGYICQFDQFHLGSADGNKVADGILKLTLVLNKAAEGAWDGVTTAEPKQVDGVYQISTGAELAWFAKTVNGGTLNINAVLTKDIDLAGYNWTPIGNNKAQYAGTFDGQSHKISNMIIIDHAYASGTGAGLFGYGKNCTVKNLTVVGSITLSNAEKSVSTAYVAGVLGGGTGVTLTNVHSAVDITINRTKGNWGRAGGVFGGGSCNAITNCSYIGTLNGYQYCGGIAGYVSSGTISNCFNAGTINSASTYAAGIVGSNAGGNTVSCYNVGAITAGTNYAGGIAGSSASGKLTNCFNIGVVSADLYAGAIAGNISNEKATLDHNYYLEGTCAKALGATKGEDTVVKINAATLVSAEFVTKMNADLETAAYKQGKYHPVFLWECGHLNTKVTTTYAAIQGTETHTVTETCECGLQLSQTTANCVDADKDLKCDNCQGPVVCKHTNTTTVYARVEGTEKHTVTVKCECGETIGEVTTVDCADENKDNKCDVCEGTIACKHTNTTTVYARVEGTEKHTVTVKCECGETIGEVTTVDCADENKDNKCDICAGTIACKHTNTTTVYARVEGTEKHTVTVKCECGETIGEVTTVDCVDENKDNKCDICAGTIACKHTNTTTQHIHIENTNTHTVKVQCECGEVVSERVENCVDTNKNQECDYCADKIPATGDRVDILFVTFLAASSLLAIAVFVCMRKRVYC